MAVGEPEIAQELACCVAWRTDLPESTQVELIERVQQMYLRAKVLKEKLGKSSGQKSAVEEMRALLLGLTDPGYEAEAMLEEGKDGDETR